jgi:hypothetical protein
MFLELSAKLYTTCFENINSLEIRAIRRKGYERISRLKIEQ